MLPQTNENSSSCYQIWWYAAAMPLDKSFRHIEKSSLRFRIIHHTSDILRFAAGLM